MANVIGATILYHFYQNISLIFLYYGDVFGGVIWFIDSLLGSPAFYFDFAFHFGSKSLCCYEINNNNTEFTRGFNPAKHFYRETESRKRF